MADQDPITNAGPQEQPPLADETPKDEAKPQVPDEFVAPEPAKRNYNTLIAILLAIIIVGILAFYFLNPFGRHSSSSTTLQLSSPLPIAVLSSLHSSALNVSLAYNARATAQGASINLSRSTINWGDGTTTPISDLSHTYSSYGNYSITLTVYDTLNSKNTTKESVLLQKSKLAFATPTEISYTTHINNLSVRINGSANPFPSQQISGAKINSLLINWGDGNTTNGYTQYTHLYGKNGTYNIKVTALDSFGNSNTVNATVRLSGPSVKFSTLCPSLLPTLNVNKPAIDGLSVSLSGTFGTSVVGGTINWGDGNTTLLSEYTHTYASQGTYHIAVQVYDKCDVKNVVSGNVTLAISGQPPLVQLNPPNQTEYRVSLSGNMLAQTQGASIDWSRSTINWGDGNTSLALYYNHTYSQEGVYSIAIKTIDTLGNQQLSFLTVKVPQLPGEFQAPANPLDVIHIGQNITAGQFKVVLLNITLPDSSGNNEAVLAVYKDNGLVENLKMSPLSSTAINSSGNTLWIYIGHTFVGVARLNWTEIQLLSQ